MSKIDIFFEETEPIDLSCILIKSLIAGVIRDEKKRKGDICIIFCSDNYLLMINKKYLNSDYYTDIVTFDYVKDDLISGDLFISIERIRENALKYRVAFFEELFRLVIHGILHLIGYNDGTDKEKKMMREKENYYLKKSGINTS